MTQKRENATPRYYSASSINRSLGRVDRFQISSQKGWFHGLSSAVFGAHESEGNAGEDRERGNKRITKNRQLYITFGRLYPPFRDRRIYLPSTCGFTRAYTKLHSRWERVSLLHPAPSCLSVIGYRPYTSHVRYLSNNRATGRLTLGIIACHTILLTILCC